MGCSGSSSADTPKPPPKDTPIINNTPVPSISDSIPVKKGSGDEATAQVKILTLGAGECGKTTLWRQLKILYCGGFNDQEKRTLIPALRTSILSDIQTLLRTARESNQNLPTELESDIDNVDGLDPSSHDDFTPEAADSIVRIWQDPVIKQIYAQSNSIGIGENADYFLDNVKRISAATYSPTNDDILKARLRTVGIFNLLMDVQGVQTLLVDVGGQKSERKNWQKCFQNVTYVLFVISLSDFDQILFEDQNMTRTTDSIELFKNIASTPSFENIPFFLILNKFDLFKKKIKANPDAFSTAYPGFTGSVTDENACIAHIKHTFLSHLPNERPEGMIEAIPTCAMDPNSVRSLFQQIAKKIVNRQ